MVTLLLMLFSLGMSFSLHPLKRYPSPEGRFHNLFNPQKFFSFLHPNIFLPTDLLKHVISTSTKTVPFASIFIYCIISNLRKKDCVILYVCVCNNIYVIYNIYDNYICTHTHMQITRNIQHNPVSK